MSTEEIPEKTATAEKRNRLSEEAQTELVEKLQELERTQTVMFKAGEIDYNTHMFIREHIFEIYRKIMGWE